MRHAICHSTSSIDHLKQPAVCVVCGLILTNSRVVLGLSIDLGRPAYRTPTARRNASIYSSPAPTKMTSSPINTTPFKQCKSYTQASHSEVLNSGVKLGMRRPHGSITWYYVETCLSVCVSSRLQAVTFEWIELETSVTVPQVGTVTFTISQPNCTWKSHVKVIKGTGKGVDICYSTS